MNSYLHIASGLLAASLLFSCVFEEDNQNRGTVVDNEFGVGALFLADGNPAANARVRIFRVGHAPDSLDLSSSGLVYSTRTNAEGRYDLDSIPNGEYNILGESEGVYSYQDSVFLSPSTDTVPPDTLDEPGQLRGVVALQPHHDPRTALVQVMGTHSYANVDEDGRFTLRSLAEGRYTLRVVTTLPEYTALVSSIQVRAGQSDSLADTLRLPFTGIPVVTGIQATYDTLRGIVHLSWNPVRFRNLAGYSIFRDHAPGIILSANAIAMTTDSSFSDTLLHAARPGFFGAGDTQSFALEYRVRVADKTDDLGPAFGKILVQAAAPALVRTTIILSVSPPKWDSIQQADSMVVRAELGNPMRSLMTLHWSVGEQYVPLDSHTLGGSHSEKDSLRYGWGKEGPYTVWVQAVDDAGTTWNGSIRVPGNQRPRISGTPLIKTPSHKPYFFEPVIVDPDGDALTISSENLPPWLHLDFRNGSLSGTPSSADSGLFSDIRISVFDGRRTSFLPPFDLMVEKNPFTPKASSPVNNRGAATAALNGKVYLVGGVSNQSGENRDLFIYDTHSDSWTKGTSSPVGLSNLTAHAIGGKIYAFGRRGDGVGNVVLGYDPITDKWMRHSDNPVERSDAISAISDGKAYFFGGTDGFGRVFREVQVYDPAADTWTMLQPTSPHFVRLVPYGTVAASAGGRIYLTGWKTRFPWWEDSDEFAIYDIATDSWSNGAPILRTRPETSLCSHGGKLFLAGGYYNTHSDFLDEYDPTTDKWKKNTGMLTGRSNMLCAESGGKIYFLLGDEQWGRSLKVDEYDPAAEIGP